MLTDTLSGSAYAATAPSAPPDDGMYGSVTTSFVISAWVMGLILNVSLSGAIVVRLWRISRRIASLTATSTNRFASSIYLVVESGAFAAIAGVSVVALFASNSPATLTGLDVVGQLVASAHRSPLLWHTLSCFVVAGIDASLDPRASSSWAD